jgi:UrcA family protein
MSGKPSIWITVAVLLLTGAWQCNAFASTTPGGEDVRRVTVRFGDLNLEQPRGVAKLYGRLRLAAAQVCGDPQQPGEALMSAEWRACVAQAVERAVVTVDRPAVTAYHLRHST